MIVRRRPRQSRTICGEMLWFRGEGHGSSVLIVRAEEGEWLPVEEDGLAVRASARRPMRRHPVEFEGCGLGAGEDVEGDRCVLAGGGGQCEQVEQLSAGDRPCRVPPPGSRLAVACLTFGPGGTCRSSVVVCDRDLAEHELYRSPRSLDSLTLQPGWEVVGSCPIGCYTGS